MKNQKLIEQIKKLYSIYYTLYNEEPLFLSCVIQYNDNKEQQNVIIKLNSSIIDDEDDNIFYYCNGLNDILSLCDDGIEDFKIIEYDGFYN